MGLFSRKKTLQETGIFDGFVDWHSHILPGVDDGIKTMEEALEVLSEYEKMGFKKVWLTPHIMEEYPNETQYLKQRFEELKGAWKGEMEISLASENMLDTLFEGRLDKNDFLPIGDEGDYLLVETSYYTPPYALDEMLDKARAKGYNLILAHPERYRYMEENDYKKYKEKGLFFQLNILSLTGAYGDSAKKKAEWLLSHDMVDMFGTDVHRLEAVRSNVTQPIHKSVKPEKLSSISKSLFP